MRGGTSLDTIRASTSSSFRPLRFINAAQLAPISSAERCASVAIRQRSRSPSPSKAPRTVCVFPISAATNKLQTLLELPYTADIGPGQELPDHATPRNIQVGREIREPLQVERPQHPRMRH